MIRVENLSFQYEGSEKLAVDDISFDVKKGEILGFLGPSGAGKSTTQKILIGLLKQYQGSVEIFGKDLNSLGKSYYERIGVSFEMPNHYQKLTGLENLQFFKSLYASETENPMELLEKVGLQEDANTRVANYSKGMQMRLNFIRALINKPELLFLDEPTAGLDPINARNIKDMIFEEKKKGHTIFLTTHNMTVADELCDRVAFIVDGKIVLVDSPRKLKIQQGERIVKVAYLKENELLEEEFSLDQLGDNGKFINLIKNENIQTIHTLESTLEDIFIRVTGRELI